MLVRCKPLKIVRNSSLFMMLPMVCLNSALIVDLDFLGSEKWLLLQDKFGNTGVQNRGRVE